MNSNPASKPIIGITIGDINGIGPEVIIKALMDNRIYKYLTPVVYGSAKTIGYYKRVLELGDYSYNQVTDTTDLNPKKTNIINCWEETVEIKVGKPTKEGGKYAFLALEKATEDLKNGNIDALVTGPINKNIMQDQGFAFPGHTEYLTEKFDATESLMLLTSDRLRVGVVSGHVPLRESASQITKERVTGKIQIFIDSLKNDFGIAKPKLAVLGLNPHAGEDGLLGSEEEEILKPVINDFKNQGHLVFGPYPADGFFGKAEFQKYDGVLAMYHDQGLIPFKTLAFERGINFTAGLPFIRTSPDHGTAYGIAGKNMASESSIREAILLAADVILNHRESQVGKSTENNSGEIL